MLADKCLPIDDQRHGVLEIGPHGQHGRPGRAAGRQPPAHSPASGESSAAGPPARPPPNRRRGGRSAARRSKRHRRFRLNCRSASSSRYAIGSLERLALVNTSSRGAPAANKQFMQRRVGQHHAQRGVVRRHLGQFRLAGASTIGRATSSSSASCAAVKLDQRAGRRRAWRPSRRTAFPCETFASAVPPPPDRFGGIAGQVITADSLDRHDLALGKQCRRAANRLLARIDRLVSITSIDSPARNRRRRSAGRGSADRADFRIRPGSGAHRAMRPSWCRPDRTASRG